MEKLRLRDMEVGQVFFAGKSQKTTYMKVTGFVQDERFVGVVDLSTGRMVSLYDDNATCVPVPGQLAMIEV